MLAVRFESLENPLELREVDRPSPDDGEVLVDLKAAGICGSDLHHVEGKFETGTVPLTLGHEGAGVVSEVGSDVEHVEAGDEVVIHYIYPCGACEPCMEGSDNRCVDRESVGYDFDGTFAEYIAVPAYSAVKMEGDVSFGVGAISGCAVATGYHALKISELDPGDTVVVFGLGGVGLHAVLWANFFGAGKVIAVDPLESKFERARAYGADLTVDPGEEDLLDVIMDETGGLGADVAVECSGSTRAMEDALKVVNGVQWKSGNVISVGLQTEPISADYWQLREGSLKVSGDHSKVELKRILKLLGNGKVDLSKSVTHEVSLDELEEGFEILKNVEDVGRVVVDTDI